MLSLRVLIAASLLVLTAGSQSSARHGCAHTLVPLHLSATNFDLSDQSFNTTYPVSGTFKVDVTYCPPVSAFPHHDTLLILLPGATYGPLYWDFAFQPETYSFVQYANARGYATLNVARIGSGLSDHPDPVRVLQTALQISAVIEIARLVRAGQLGLGPRRGRNMKIVGVGHSLGSAILNGVMVQAPDALHGVVLSGYAHTMDVPPANFFPPANSLGIPRFAALPDGYVSTPNGDDSRAALYGPAGTYDAAVLAFDEAHKDVVSVGEFTTYPRFVRPAPQFAGHVLAVNGAYDSATCGDPACGGLADETKAYPAAMSIEAVPVADSGHDLNLHLIAPHFFDIVVSWLERRGF